MFGVKCKGTVCATLAWAGFCWGQQPLRPVPEGAPSERIITVQEFGKDKQQCKILEEVLQPDGLTAYEVQDVATGERMTIVEGSQAPGATGEGSSATPAGHLQARFSRIFHWDQNAASRPDNSPIVSVACDAPSCAVDTAPGTTAVSSVASATPCETCDTCQAAAPTPPAPPAHADLRRIIPHWFGQTQQVPTKDPSAPYAVAAPKPDSAQVPMKDETISPHAAPTASGEAPGGRASVTLTGREKGSPGAEASTDASAGAGSLPAIGTMEPAQPSDFHVSWGKADDHTSRTQPKVPLPQADTTAPDPLKNLEGYSHWPFPNRTPLVNAPAAPIAPPAPANPGSAGTTAGAAPKAPAAAPAAPPVAVAPIPPIVNSTAQAPSAPTTASNAFAMTNAFSGSARAWRLAPTPGAFSQPPVGGDIVNMTLAPPPPAMAVSTASSYGAGQALGARAAPPAPPATVQATPAAQESTPDVLLTMLHSALFPSHREMAAQHLATNFPGNLQVIAALATAARQDPAPTVRAGCVRALVLTGVSDPTVVTTLQSLKADSDAGVRAEVELALARFAQLSPEPNTVLIQPVSAPLAPEAK